MPISKGNLTKELSPFFRQVSFLQISKCFIAIPQGATQPEQSRGETLEKANLTAVSQAQVWHGISYC